MKNLHDMSPEEIDQFLERSARAAGVVQNVSLGVLLGLVSGFACGLFSLVWWFGAVACAFIALWFFARRHACKVAEREERKGKS